MPANRWRYHHSSPPRALPLRKEYPVHQHLSCLNIPPARQRRTGCHHPSHAYANVTSLLPSPWSLSPPPCPLQTPFQSPGLSLAVRRLEHCTEYSMCIPWALVGAGLVGRPVRAGLGVLVVVLLVLVAGAVWGMGHRMRMSRLVLGRARCELLCKVSQSISKSRSVGSHTVVIAERRCNSRGLHSSSIPHSSNSAVVYVLNRYPDPATRQTFFLDILRKI